LRALNSPAYGQDISVSSVSEYFIASGYKFKKAKKVLTSSDPDYRDKLVKITETLSQLQPDEKFFSIDEFGPFSVKIRGGTALVAGDTVRTIPQRQKSKGSLICTAALELSTNQVTHFYSAKKNTAEMIKLLKRLIVAYRNQRRLYASWDLASWHASKALNKAVDEFNADAYRACHTTPLVKLMPLPSGAQFLNVYLLNPAAARTRRVGSSAWHGMHLCRVARQCRRRIGHWRTDQRPSWIETRR
jgi:hypothetical protein